MPESSLFSIEIPVNIGLINYGAHLGHDSVITLAHEGRLQFFKSLGYETETDIEGRGAFVSDLAVIYKSEGFHGDQIRIDICLGEITRVRFDLYHRLFNQRTRKDLAHVKTGIVMVDMKSRKATPIPEELLKKLDK